MGMDELYEQQEQTHGHNTAQFNSLEAKLDLLLTTANLVITPFHQPPYPDEEAFGGASGWRIRV